MAQKKTAWILYYSNSGNTKNLADLAEATLKDCGWAVESASLMDFNPAKMEKPGLVLLGTPTHFWAVPAMARQMGIKVYTIGLGTNGTAMFPVARDLNGKLIFRNAPVEIDEELLRYIAKETEGQYFRATDNQKLEVIYDQIDKLEKTEIEEFKYYNYTEKFRPLVLFAASLVFLEMVLSAV